MPNEDRSIEHLIIEIESKTAKATKNMEKLLAITERLNKAIHAGGFEKLNAQMSKLAALDVANATRFGSAIGAATAKAKGLSEGIGAVDTKASNLGKNAEKLTNNITHAVEAAKKLESHLPKAVTGNGNALPPPSVGGVGDYAPFPGEDIPFSSGPRTWIVDDFEEVETTSHKIKRNLSEWFQRVKKVEDSTKRTYGSMSAIKTILMYSGLFTLVSTITKGITTGVQNIALASSEANDVLSRYQTLNNQLQNSIGSALIPTLHAAYPLIELLGNGLIGVANALNIVSSAASGKNTFFAANKVAQDYAKSLSTVKNALTGFDEINVISPVNQNTFTETEFDGGDVVGSIAKLAMLTAGIIGLRMATKTLDMGKVFASIGGFKTLFVVTDAVWLAFEAVDAWQNGLDWGGNVRMITAVTVGMLAMGAAFGATGLKVAGLVGGVTLAVTGIKDSVTEGINWTNATLTLGGTALLGAIIGSFFGPFGTLVGGGVGLLVGAFTNGGIAIVQNWDGIWPKMKSGFVNFGNFFIGAWESIVNFFIRGGNKIAGLLEKLGIGDGKWWDEVSFNRLSVPAYATGGFPEDGLFMANHNEFIGSFGGRTAVANNEMIVEGIAEGVRDAQSAQNDLLREQNELLRQLLRKSGGTIPVSTIRAALDRQNKRAGRVVVPVGT